MKQHLSEEDMESLTDKQKEKLRGLWVPSKGDMIYSEKNLTFNEINNDDWEYGGEEVEIEKGEYLCTGTYTFKDETSVYIGGGDTGESADKKFFLPLLNIGQMMEILGKNKSAEVLNSCVIEDFCDLLWKDILKLL